MLHALNFFEHLFVFCLSSAAAPFIILLYSLSQQRCCCLSNYRHIIFYEFKDFSSGFSLAVVIFLKKSPDNRRNERKKYQIQLTTMHSLANGSERPPDMLLLQGVSRSNLQKATQPVSFLLFLSTVVNLMTNYDHYQTEELISLLFTLKIKN